ncbi:hypothetical protein C4577_02165 [Candidatus Parcubacteria bacterium]|nr:MAG: hypothetical protein C4577_02165 [Candidatus Parcubacteria bacterium]
MTSREFCYWLQGYFEIRENSPSANFLNAEQMDCIKKHLAMVFHHEIDPSYADSATLNNIHHSSGETLMRC